MLSGRSPATKIQILILCQDRVAAEVYDLNALGAALGSTATENAIVILREQEQLFNPYHQNFTDEVGRIYTALENLIGHFVNRSRNLEWWTDTFCRKCSLIKASLQITPLL